MALVRTGVTGWITHSNLPGKPDVYFPKARIAIFLDGCFWHGCGRCGHVPKTNSLFWETKIGRNQARDKKNSRLLKKEGIHVIRAWEHALSSQTQLERILARIQALLRDKRNKWKASTTGLMTQKNSRTKGTPNVGTSRKPFVALSFFTGAMVLDLGLEQAGISSLLASEIDEPTRKTIEANRPDIELIGDLRNYTAQEIRKRAKLHAKREIDLIFGGPPCQAFSTAGKRQAFEDERGNVFLKFIDLILDLKPRYAVIENVRGLLSAPLAHRPHSYRGAGFPPLTATEGPGGALYFILEMLRAGGYAVSFNLYNSANFGAPQIRERVVVVCSRDGQSLPHLSPTHSRERHFGLKPWRTFRDATSTLPKSPCDYVSFPEKRLRFYKMLKQGQNWRNLPEELQQEALGKSYFSGGGKTGFLRRLAWDMPSPTLVTHPAMPATDLAHPEEDRPLSVQEYKRLQEFPDSWKVEGSLTDQYRQVGNAVPASLGLAIGKLLLANDAGRRIKTIPEFPYSRYRDTDERRWQEEYSKRQLATRQATLSFSKGAT